MIFFLNNYLLDNQIFFYFNINMENIIGTTLKNKYRNIISQLEITAADPYEQNYVNTALQFFSSEEILDNIDNIKLYKYSDNGNPKDFLKNFFKQIFNNISVKPYAKDKLQLEQTSTGTVWRPNHGGLNHLRSAKYGIWFLNKFRERNPELFYTLFPNKSLLILAICSTPFESFMRIDEEGSFAVRGKMTEKNFNMIYPDLIDLVPRNSSSMSPHQIVSSIFFKILSNACFDSVIDSYKQQIVSRAIGWYWEGRNSENGNSVNLESKYLKTNIDYKSEIKWDINNYDISSLDFQRLVFFLSYCIAICGHYLDHCRCMNFSSLHKPFETIDNNWLRLFKNIAKITKDDEREIFDIVIDSLYKTEFEKPLECGESNGKPRIPNQFDDFLNRNLDMSTYCRQCVPPNKRYKNENFYLYSTNFEAAYDVLEIDNDIHELIQNYKPEHFLDNANKKNTSTLLVDILQKYSVNINEIIGKL